MFMDVSSISSLFRILYDSCFKWTVMYSFCYSMWFFFASWSLRFNSCEGKYTCHPNRFNRLSLVEIRSWWQVPSIAHFCSLFRSAFGLTDFEIEVRYPASFNRVHLSKVFAVSFRHRMERMNAVLAAIPIFVSFACSWALRRNLHGQHKIDMKSTFFRFRCEGFYHRSPLFGFTVFIWMHCLGPWGCLDDFWRRRRQPIPGGPPCPFTTGLVQQESRHKVS